MLKNYYFIIVSFILLLTACQPAAVKLPKHTDLPLLYAKGFKVSAGEGYVLIDVVNPWDTSKLMQTYVLVKSTDPLPPSLPKGILLRTPIDNVIVYSAVHCACLVELNCLDRIAGVCEAQYINIPSMKQAIAQAKIKDVGLASDPDVEQIIDLQASAVFASPIEGISYGRIEKSGIPIIESVDYMESSPLARAEWIKFYAYFFDQAATSDQLFLDIEQKYLAVKKQVEQQESRPTVLNEKKYGMIWYMPGGKSYMANLLRDAGASYEWGNSQNAGSEVASFEEVLDKASDANYWLIKYGGNQDLSYTSLKSEYAGYAHFSAFKNNKIFGCNTQTTDYYNDIVLHPDWIVQDLAAVFHPYLFPNYSPRYFFPLVP